MLRSICRFQVYNKDVMLLVILTITYAEEVLVVVRSKIIDRAMGMIKKGELAKSITTWRHANLVWSCWGHSVVP